MMRALLLNSEYPPLGAGAGVACQLLIKDLKNQPELEIDLITASPTNQFEATHTGNLRIFKLPVGKNIGRNPAAAHHQSIKDLLTYFIQALRFSWKLTAREKYDLSHSFFTFPGGAISLILQKTRGIPYIVSLRGSDVPGYNPKLSAHHLIAKPVTRKTWRAARFCVANSAGLKNLALKANPNQEIVVIPNGINTNFFKPAEKPQKKEAFTVLSVSRLAKIKNLSTLIKACAGLVIEIPDLSVKIVGTGLQKRRLENLVGDLNLGKVVSFLSAVPHHQLPPIYQKADLFVINSLNESMSNAMLEAMATGLPVITNRRNMAQSILNSQNSLMVRDPRNSDELKEAILKLYRDRNLRKSLGENARQTTRNLSPEKISQRYLELYQKIAGVKVNTGSKFYDRIRRHDWSKVTDCGPSARSRFRIVDRLITKHKLQGDLVDIGCGTGSFLENISRRKLPLKTLWGIDFSKEALRICRRKNLGIQTLQRNILEPKFPLKQLFDIATCLEVLEHLQHPQIALGNIRELLKKKGTLIISTPFSQKYFSTHDRYAGHYRRFELEELESLLEANGFTIIESFVWGFPFYSLYHRFLTKLPPGKVRNPQAQGFKELVSQTLYHLFKCDDYFRSRKRGRRIFIVAQRI